MASDPEILTVTDLTYRVKSLLEHTFSVVCVTGEVSNFKPHTSGHWYFSLKDERSALRCVMFRRQNQSVAFLPQDGMQVVLHGAVSIYEARGEYQLVAERFLPVGEGPLAIAFEQLKTRLMQEGLFDPARKRPLPSCPERIGVITSASGAAIRDIIRVLRRRAPYTHIIVRPTPVQGEGAARQIAGAIEEMNAYGEIDVLIIGRGGGSIEDLWAFNEEPVVRAIAGSKIPTVSAVGHETDTTLSDFAADVRASTPSAAAETVAPDRQTLMNRVASAMTWLHRTATDRIDQSRQRMDELHRIFQLKSPQHDIRQRTQQNDELTRRLTDQYARLLEQRKQQVLSLSSRLHALSPLAVLERGYAVCRIDGRIVRDASTLRVGERLSVRFHKGSAICRVESLNGPSSRTPAMPDIRQNQGRLNLFDEI